MAMEADSLTHTHTYTLLFGFVRIGCAAQNVGVCMWVVGVSSGETHMAHLSPPPRSVWLCEQCGSRLFSLEKDVESGNPLSTAYFQSPESKACCVCRGRKKTLPCSSYRTREFSLGGMCGL